MIYTGFTEAITRWKYVAGKCRPPEIPGAPSTRDPYSVPKIGPDSNIAKNFQKQTEGINANFYISGDGSVEQQNQKLLDRANTQSAEERRLQQEHAAHCR
jgi:hypothetical protein